MRAAGTRDAVGRVGEAIAIAGTGKLLDLTIERWKARQASRQSTHERIDALEARITALQERIDRVDAEVAQLREQRQWSERGEQGLRKESS